MNKNKCKGSDRNRLDIDQSLSGTIATKLARPESKCPCYQFKPDEELIKKGKQAINDYNKQHCSKTKDKQLL